MQTDSRQLEANQWRHQRERSNRFALQLLVRLALLLGRRFVSLLMAPIAAYYYCFSPASRRASRDYLLRMGLCSKTKKLKDHWLGLKHFYTFALVSTDRIFFLKRRWRPYKITMRGDDIVNRHLRQSNGALLMVSHVGSFEVMRVLAQQDIDLPVKILMDRKHNARAMDLLATLDSAMANNIIDSDQNAADLAITLKSLFDEGHFVGVMVDRMTSGERAVTCDFLGGKVQLPLGPWLLAAVMKVPVISCVGLYRGRGRYDIVFESVAESLVVGRKNREEILQGYIQSFMDALQSNLRSAPYNWFNFYPYWLSGLQVGSENK